MPVWLNVTGKRIIELPIIEFAMAMPVDKGDFIIDYLSTIPLIG
jgi:hypothetical protein